MHCTNIIGEKSAIYYLCIYLVSNCFHLFSESFTFSFPGVGGQQCWEAIPYSQEEHAAHSFMEIFLVLCVSQTEMKVTDFVCAGRCPFRERVAFVTM